MAIDFTDYSAIADTLKTVYGEGLENQFNDEIMTYNLFPKSDRIPGGEGYAFGLRYARTQSVGARNEAQHLPDPLVGKYDKGLILPKQMYGVLKLSGKAMHMARSNVMSFVNTLQDQVADAYQSVIVDLNRMAHGDGSGKIATLSEASDTLSVAATWTVTCDNTLGVTYAQEGMLVDFYDGASVDESSVASRIDYINPSDKTIEMEANAGDYKANHPQTGFSAYTIVAEAVPTAATMVKLGARDAAYASSDTPVEMIGLEAIYDDGTALSTFENITVSTNPKWSANIIDNSSVDRELSLDLMLQACDVTRFRSGKKVNIIRMGLGQRRKYANLLLPDVRFAPGQLKGGYETFSFAGGDGSIEIIVDPMTQPGKIYFEPKDIIKRYEVAGLGWGEGLNNDNMQWRSGYDEFELFLRVYTNLGVENRNSLTKISDLVEPNLY
jgi:hypothetical protein